MQNKQLLRLGAEKLSSSGISSPAHEARILLAQACEENQEYLLLNFDQEVSDVIIKRYLSYIARRQVHEPISYITGVKEFYGRDFIVTKSVLIPRPDTEILVESIIKNTRSGDTFKILELGAGSGAIAVTLALELPLIEIVAVDISDKALDCAKSNVKKYAVSDRVKLLQSDWYSALDNIKFDIIVSNPPYISESEINYMANETKRYEPEEALFAANDGLKCYEDILKNAQNYLADYGRVYLELGFNQYERVEALARKYDFNINDAFKDLQGYKRVVCLNSISSKKLTLNNN